MTPAPTNTSERSKRGRGILEVTGDYEQGYQSHCQVDPSFAPLQVARDHQAQGGKGEQRVQHDGVEWLPADGNPHQHLGSRQQQHDGCYLERLDHRAAPAPDAPPFQPGHRDDGDDRRGVGQDPVAVAHTINPARLIYEVMEGEQV